MQRRVEAVGGLGKEGSRRELGVWVGSGARNRVGTRVRPTAIWGFWWCVHMCAGVCVCACAEAPCLGQERGTQLSPTPWAAGSPGCEVVPLATGRLVEGWSGGWTRAQLPWTQPTVHSRKNSGVSLEVDPQGWQQFLSLLFGPREPQFTLPEKAIVFGSKNN